MAARSAHALACAAILLSSGAALAQTGNNRITILQAGEGNRLTVDQAGATGSRVGGLTVTLGASSSGQLVLESGPQFVPGENGTDPGVPSLGVAQALVPSFDRNDPAPAVQRGGGNTADVNIQGTGGFVGLLQNNSGAALGNIADVSLNGNGTALIGQEGGGNEAELSVSGTNAYGAILQRGSGNDVNLSVIGNNASGTISQVGSNNASALSVTGVGLSSVTYVLQGNGIQSFDPSQGVEVSTNAPSVTITQTAFGGQ